MNALQNRGFQLCFVLCQHFLRELCTWKFTLYKDLFVLKRLFRRAERELPQQTDLPLERQAGVSCSIPLSDISTSPVSSVGLPFSIPSLTPMIQMFCRLDRQTRSSTRLLSNLASSGHLQHWSVSNSSFLIPVSFRPPSFELTLCTTSSSRCFRPTNSQQFKSAGW